MRELKMLTQEEVSDLLNTATSNVAMLREVGVLPAIKIGRSFMFPKESVKQFQVDYLGMDVSNRVKALESLHEVQLKKEVEMYVN
ncbi:MAG: helix-turn-helix domain-containing protein [Erysipelotrichaceae bacterium]|nr:helix-turn-helix domain-containing protein [Erysipelotrichaceae bacterium]